MATVTGITAEKAQQIEDDIIVNAHIDGTGQLILTTAGGTDIVAGQASDPTALANHAALTAAHGATGAVMGTTNTQTATNKTLIQPTIADFVNATHNHDSSSHGGGLYIGKADSPAPATSLTAQNLADGDPAKVMASLSVPAGRWLILAACEGVTMGSATFTKFTYDLKSSVAGVLTAKQCQASSTVTGVEGGRQMWGWLDTPSTATITYTIVKNGTGALVTNSTLGALLAIRMG